MPSPCRALAALAGTFGLATAAIGVPTTTSSATKKPKNWFQVAQARAMLAAAAEASEAATAQGAFWPMHDVLLDHQAKLAPEHMVRYAGELGLDVERFKRELRAHTSSDRVAADVERADLSGVAGTPGFFVSGQRHKGAYDVDTLSRIVRTARARAAIRPPHPAPARQPLLDPWRLNEHC